MILRALLLALALLGAAAGWALGTASGLQAAAALAVRFTDGRMSIGAVEGILAGDVRVRDFAWNGEGTTVAIDEAVVNLRLSRLLLGRIQAERLEAGELRVATHEAASPPPEDEAPAPLTVTMPLRLAIEDGRIGRFRLQLAGRPEWGLTEARFGARWRDQWIVIGMLRAHTEEAGEVAARGRLAILDSQLHFKDFELEGPGRLRAEGALALGARADSALDLAWSELQWPQAPLGLASREGEARLEGPWRAYRWRVRAQAVASGIAGDLDAAGAGDLGHVAIERARIGALEGSISGRGRVDWSRSLTTELALEWGVLNPAAVWKDWPGALSGRGTLAATWSQRPRVQFDLALRDSQLRGYPFELAAVGRTEDGRVILRTATLASGPSRLQASGQLLPQLDLSANLDGADLGALWVGLAGRGRLQLQVTGEPGAPRVRGGGTVEDFAYRGLRARHGRIEGDVSLERRSQVVVELTEVEAGLPLQRAALRARGLRRAHRIELEAHGVEGGGRIALEGGERGGSWRGQLVEAEFAPPSGDAPPETWVLEESAALSYANGRVTLAPACLQAEQSRACAEVAASAQSQYLAFRTRNLEYRHLRPWLRGPWAVTGAMSGTGLLRFAGGELVQLRADLTSTAGALEGPDVRLAFGPGELRVQPDEAKLHARMHLRPAGGDVVGEFWISPGTGLIDRPMLGDLSLKLPDLSWLPVLSPEIAKAEGAIDARLQVSGTPRAPSLDGRLDVTGGRVELATPGIELADIAASFERGRDAPLRLQARARSGEGQFTVDGEFRSLQPRLDGELTVRGENVLGLNRGDIRAWLSPDLRLAFSGRSARLTGVLGVPRADITPRDLDRGGVGPSGDQVLVAADADPARGSAFAVESEVKIVLGDAVRIDGLGLTTRLTGGITAYDDPSRPTRGRGELRLEGGRYRAYGQDLQIESGRLLFNGGPVTRPAIDIKAVRKATEEIKVGLRARGTLEAPEFSLFSEPAMSQEEQLSWLVLGRSLSATLDRRQQSELSNAAVSLGLTGGDFLAQRLAPRLGLDEVSVGSKPGETADLARFTIGKYLSPRLFVSYGVGLFQPGHFFRLQYDISRRFKLVGETGLQQSGDLLYTIER